MSIEACVAHALHRDLDVMEALPELADVPMEQLEPYVEQYVCYIQETLCTLLKERGDRYIRAQDAAGFCAACVEVGLNLPTRMMLRICQTILNLSTLDAKFILDTNQGSSLYFVKMSIA